MTHMLAISLRRKLAAKLLVKIEQIISLVLPMRTKIGESLDGSTNQHGCLMDLEVSDVVDALRDFVVAVDLHACIVGQSGSDVKCRVGQSCSDRA